MSSSDDIFTNAYKTPEELKKMMVNSNPIVSDFILKGQMSFIYGPPNCGKTLLIMALLKDVKEDIIYLNADDGINGGTEKVKLAQDNNYKMILCGTDNNNDPKNMMESIEKKLEKDSLFYKDKIVIFDTVKKFVDPLDKKASAYFLQIMRKITLSGGSIILLGHTNKHRANDDKLIFEGVGDWMSDMDCVYSLDFELNEATNEKVLTFENQKSRGVVPQTTSYKYYAGKELESYQERVDSVEKLSDSEAEQIQQQSHIRYLESKYEDVLLFIVSILKQSSQLSQSQIRQMAKDDVDCTSTDNEIRKCLKAFDGIKWISKSNLSKNNAKEYQLNL